MSANRPIIAGVRNTAAWKSLKSIVLKELEQENSRLKRLVADQALDNAILKEVSPGETSKPDAAKGGGRACA